MKSYFGTDGVRGRANTFPMTPEVALQLGKAAGKYFRRGDHRHMVVIGKDTRRSGYMFENALVAGFTAAGMDVRLIGPSPTPAIGMLTRSLRADLGVMITASHNPSTDNGIKLFGPDGFKLDDEAEVEIEAMMDDPANGLAAAPAEIGQVVSYKDARGRYIEAAKASFPRELSLDGMKVVIDCANGAGYRVAPQALYELGADVDAIGVSPNGANINLDCGSTAPDAMVARVVKTGADIGIALDGDGDRLIICDEKGRIIDGDQILARIGFDMKRRGTLSGSTVVATIMSNLGLERFFREQGVTLERTKVGDRYVVERLRATGLNLGGEQSGHIVMTDFATTGDGLIAALQILSACVREDRPVSELCALFDPAPQVKRNIRYSGQSPLEHEGVQRARQNAEKRLNGSGRLILRLSGTEPVVRVMTEGDDERLLASVVDDLSEAIAEASNREEAVS